MTTHRRNYFILVLLAVLFLVPGVSAYFFYKHPEWLVGIKTNKGVLLNPPFLLSDEPVAPVTAKWQLLFFCKENCGAECRKQLEKLARIRLALGRHLYEVDTELLLGLNAKNPSDDLLQMLKEWDMHVARLGAVHQEQMGRLDDKLEIFIANPDHYVVLAYKPSVKSSHIYHDLKQLLIR